MKTKVLHHFLQKYLLPELPGWAIAGKSIYRKQTPELALLIDFEDSRWAKDEWSHVRAVLVPLYDEFPCVSLAISRQLRNVNHRIVAGSEEVVSAHLVRAVDEEAWPFLRPISTLDGLCENLIDQMRRENERYEGPTSNYVPHLAIFEALAGAELLRSNVNQAIAYANLLRDRNADDGRDIAREEAARWQRFGQLMRENPDEAKAELQRRVQLNAAKYKFI